ncbi:MAG TPA: 16S rRNA (cytosine(1402)-N(4))-methyltransferase RsmH [Saprospiraceae bacterium]|nr:16S rRNA (cytosine(1402)-N(4))-methyltransferase RsmH [Saprospiraceae bacterium]
MEYHIPVLLSNVIEALKINPKDIYCDVTYGAGGHSKSIIENLGKEGWLFGFDQDIDARANCLANKNFTLIPVNYRYLQNYMDYYGVESVDGILADLGVSSYQLDQAKRGFSYRFDSDLDMRMDQSQSKSAIIILNEYSKDDLVRIFSGYGEVRNSKTLAEAIVTARKKSAIESSYRLNEILNSVIVGNQNKYFAQVYQALRIEVNDELESLKEMLQAGKELLKPGGRFVVMSYHSLEDRLVKNFFKTGNFEGKVVKDDFGHIDKPFKIINSKPIEADAEEQQRNPRSRSAKLRIAEKPN